MHAGLEAIRTNLSCKVGSSQMHPMTLCKGKEEKQQEENAHHYIHSPVTCRSTCKKTHHPHMQQVRVLMERRKRMKNRMNGSSHEKECWVAVTEGEWKMHCDYVCFSSTGWTSPTPLKMKTSCKRPLTSAGPIIHSTHPIANIASTISVIKFAILDQHPFHV